MPRDTTPLLTVELHATQFPGIRFEDGHTDPPTVYQPVYAGVQRGEEVIDRVPGNAPSAVFRAAFSVSRQKDGRPNFLGPYAKGTPQERFFYICWGVVSSTGIFHGFRRAKIPLWKLTWLQVEAALQSGGPIVGEVTLTDKKGGPSCATLKDDLFRWRA